MISLRSHIIFIILICLSTNLGPSDLGGKQPPLIAKVEDDKERRDEMSVCSCGNAKLELVDAWSLELVRENVRLS